MPVALEAVDLAALAAEALTWALLTVLVILLAKLVSVMHFKIDLGIVAFEPLGWLANALSSYVLTGAEDARKAVAGAMKATFDGLVWGLDELYALITDLATKAKDGMLWLWQHTVQPYVQAVIKPIYTVAVRAETDVTNLAKKEARDIAATAANAEAFAWKRLQNAEDFTREQVAAARADLGAAIHKVDSYVHSAEAVAEALPGQITADFDSLWKALRDNIRPDQLAELLSAGLLSGMLLRVLAQEAGLDQEACRAKHKQICGVDPAQWTKLLGALALLGAAVDFRQLVDFANSLAKQAGDAIVAVE